MNYRFLFIFCVQMGCVMGGLQGAAHSESAQDAPIQEVVKLFRTGLATLIQGGGGDFAAAIDKGCALGMVVEFGMYGPNFGRKKLSGQIEKRFSGRDYCKGTPWKIFIDLPCKKIQEFWKSEGGSVGIEEENWELARMRIFNYLSTVHLPRVHESKRRFTDELCVLFDEKNLLWILHELFGGGDPRYLARCYQIATSEIEAPGDEIAEWGWTPAWNGWVGEGAETVREGEPSGACTVVSMDNRCSRTHGCNCVVQ